MNPLVLAPTTLMSTPPLAFVQAAGAAGFDGVGLRVYPSPHLPYTPLLDNPPLIAAVKQELRAANLSVLDLFTFYFLPETDIAAFLPALALGASFGARYAVMQGNDPDWSRLVDRFGEFCDATAELDLIATIEFMPARHLATLPRAVQLAREVGRQNVSICVDPLHLVRSGGTASDVSRVDRHLFAYAQLSDGILAPGEPNSRQLGRTEMGPGERRLPGEGTLPLHEIIAALPQALPLSVEVLMPENWPGTTEAWAKRTLDASRAFLSQTIAARD